MLEDKLIVGRHIVLPAMAPNYLDTPNAADFTIQAPINLYLGQSSRSGGAKVSTAGTDDGSKAHRKFQWLGWNPGKVSHVTLGQRDVLTGPMSGCDLLLFRIGGVVHAGHIGTDVGSPADTAQAKAAWNGWVGANAANFIGRFNPARYYTAGPGMPPAPNGTTDSGFTIFGLYTTTQQFYSVFTYSQTNDAKQFRIADIVNVGATIHPATV